MSFHPARPRTTPRTLKETQEVRALSHPQTPPGSPHPRQRSPQVLAKLGARSEAGLTLLLSAAPFAHKAGGGGGRGHRGFKDEHPVAHHVAGAIRPHHLDRPCRPSQKDFPPPPPQYGHRAPGPPEERSGALTQAKARGGDHSPQQVSAQPR